jgi:hypothetical protein
MVIDFGELLGEQFVHFPGACAAQACYVALLDYVVEFYRFDVATQVDVDYVEPGGYHQVSITDIDDERGNFGALDAVLVAGVGIEDGHGCFDPTPIPSPEREGGLMAGYVLEGEQIGQIWLPL